MEYSNTSPTGNFNYTMATSNKKREDRHIGVHILQESDTQLFYKNSFHHILNNRKPTSGTGKRSIRILNYVIMIQKHTNTERKYQKSAS